VRFSQICISRPVLSTVMSLVILVFGGISLTLLQNRELPDVDPPMVSVSTFFPGAAPEVVETSITQPLEDELMGIEGIKHITSLSQEQRSAIQIEFELYRDIDVAAADVRDRAARARRVLPDDAEPPIVAKADTDAQAVMWIAVKGAGYSQIELSTIADTLVKDHLSKLPGVANIMISGERRYSMRLWIDQQRLTAQQLTIADVAAALRRENIDIPSGRVEGTDREFTVRTLGELHTPEQYADLIIARIDGEPVRIRDVGRAEIGPENERSLLRYNGTEAVGVGVVRQSKANTLDVISAAKRELALIQPLLPAGVDLAIGHDISVYIKNSVRDVTLTIFYAIALVLVVIYVFLRSARATIIPAVSIPVSIMGAFAVLYFLDFSINTLTLMGLTLAIGLVVDDAIVVLENITRWIEQGMSTMEATRRGMDEIAFAVVAASLSTVAVFLPLSFLTDTTGRLFREFGITVASAVAISGFVALTLSPALAARVLRQRSEDRGVKALLAEGVERLRAGYARLLGPVLARPRLATLVGIGWVALGIVLLGQIEREFVPTTDRGQIVSFTRGPEGSTVDYTSRHQREVEDILIGTPEVESAFSIVALGFEVNKGVIFTNLVPWNERERSQQEIVGQLFGQFSQVAALEAFPTNWPTLGTNFNSTPVSLVVQGPDVRQLARYSEEITRRARGIPGLLNVQTDLRLDKPQLQVQIDRERASDLGVSVRDIATTLQILLGGLDLSTFKLGGETYDVIAQLERPARSNPKDLFGLYVRAASGAQIPLDSLVSVEETISPPGLPHFDRLRSATITASLLADVPLGRALTEIQAIADDVLPEGGGYGLRFAGESEEFFESSDALLFAYVLAVILIYLVLAAQFESFIHPATIMVAVAVSFTGALLALEVTGHTLNLFSQIGLVMLVGLVAKNSILIVEFANQLRDRGLDVREAITQAARTRFRPVLMTALSTIAGIMPIALGLGAGGEARAPLGVAVVGGMLFSTLLTFFLVPVVYLGFARLQARFGPVEEHPVLAGASGMLATETAREKSA
jgi:hydrophobe/amphiphile efflux-1 (HAE1) family protein